MNSATLRAFRSGRVTSTIGEPAMIAIGSKSPSTS